MSNFSENDLKKLEAVRGKEHRNHRPPTPRNVEGSAYCVVLDQNYSSKNWIYVVLSRVRTLSGLYLCQPLDEMRPFPIDDKLLVEESRLAGMEEELMEHRRNNMCSNMYCNYLATYM